MADKFSKEVRSKIMSKIRSKDTSIELEGYKLLRKAGLHYRKYPKNIKGQPDAVNKKRKIAVFFDGDFWHGYDYEKSIKTRLNSDYWTNKIEKNMERDARTTQELKENGWKVIRFWEHVILKKPNDCIRTIQLAISKP
jgi:DNA mismatch endonuclease (patch repair protein)